MVATSLVASAGTTTVAMDWSFKDQGIEDVDTVIPSTFQLAVVSTKGGALLSIWGGKSQIGHDTASHLDLPSTSEPLLSTPSENFEYVAVKVG